MKSLLITAILLAGFSAYCFFYAITGIVQNLIDKNIVGQLDGVSIFAAAAVGIMSAILAYVMYIIYQKEKEKAKTEQVNFKG